MKWAGTLPTISRRPADPLNPHITKIQASLLELFGRETAKRFDERRFAYFNREVFDSFYPGYGESWPIFHGAIGMTYDRRRHGPGLAGKPTTAG